MKYHPQRADQRSEGRTRSAPSLNIPLKLAWAITIHKSQGLTFERAIIDAQAAFAHGQVYVALSRCKSFEGIVLRSKIAYSSVKTDSAVKNYTEKRDKNAPDEAHLIRSKRDFQQMLVLELFDFSALSRYFEQMNRVFLEHENTLHAEAGQQFKTFAKPRLQTRCFAVPENSCRRSSIILHNPVCPKKTGLQVRIQKASALFRRKTGQNYCRPRKSTL